MQVPGAPLNCQVEYSANPPKILCDKPKLYAVASFLIPKNSWVLVEKASWTLGYVCYVLERIQELRFCSGW